MFEVLGYAGGVLTWLGWDEQHGFYGPLQPLTVLSAPTGTGIAELTVAPSLTDALGAYSLALGMFDEVVMVNGNEPDIGEGDVLTDAVFGWPPDGDDTKGIEDVLDAFDRKTVVKPYTRDGEAVAGYVRGGVAKLDPPLKGNGPLPMANGLYYRFHHKDAPFDSGHATSQNLVTPEELAAMPPKIAAIVGKVKDGYSAFWNPHHLDEYLREMSWDDADDAKDRRVIVFQGSPVGEGGDGEPLVMPSTGKIEHRMTLSKFRDRLDLTPNGYGQWDEHTWGDGPNGMQADDGYRTLAQIGEQAQSSKTVEVPLAFSELTPEQIELCRDVGIDLDQLQENVAAWIGSNEKTINVHPYEREGHPVSGYERSGEHAVSNVRDLLHGARTRKGKGRKGLKRPRAGAVSYAQEQAKTPLLPQDDLIERRRRAMAAPHGERSGSDTEFLDNWWGSTVSRGLHQTMTGDPGTLFEEQHQRIMETGARLDAQVGYLVREPERAYRGNLREQKKLTRERRVMEARQDRLQLEGAVRILEGKGWEFPREQYSPEAGKWVTVDPADEIARGVKAYRAELKKPVEDWDQAVLASNRGIMDAYNEAWDDPEIAAIRNRSMESRIRSVDLIGNERRLRYSFIEARREAAYSVLREVRGIGGTKPEFQVAETRLFEGGETLPTREFDRRLVASGAQLVFRGVHGQGSDDGRGDRAAAAAAATRAGILGDGDLGKGIYLTDGKDLAVSYAQSSSLDKTGIVMRAAIRPGMLIATEKSIPASERQEKTGERPADWARRNGYSGYATGAGTTVITSPSAVSWDERNYSLATAAQYKWGGQSAPLDVATAMKQAARWVPDKWVSESNEYGPLEVDEDQRGRGQYAHRIPSSPRPSQLTLSASDSGLGLAEGEGTAVHEFMHRAESVTDGINGAEWTFYVSRVSPGRNQPWEDKISLRDALGSHGYEPGEMTRPDDFVSLYAGKTYGDDPDSDYELLSTGVQDLVSGSSEMLENDQEYRQFVLGMLALA